MVPEGENDSLFSSMNIIEPSSVTREEEVTLHASIYKDKERKWFLKVHLPSEEDYEDLSVLCKYQVDDKEAAIFLPCKIDNKSWKVDTSFISDQNGILSFFMCKPWNAEISLQVAVRTDENRETIDELISFGKSEFEVISNGFPNNNQILEDASTSVMTVIGFMNLTKCTIQVSPPALESGMKSSSNPWPTELPPLQVVNMVTRKINVSTVGSVLGHGSCNYPST